MKPIRIALVVFVTLTVVSAPREASAQTLVSRSFDLLLEGDDPTQSFTFPLPFDPDVPSRVRFDGYFQNLVDSETGVLIGLIWPSEDGTGNEGPGIPDFSRLPASGRLPAS